MITSTSIAAAEVESCADTDTVKDPRHAVIAEFQKAVAERKAAMDAIGDER